MSNDSNASEDADKSSGATKLHIAAITAGGALAAAIISGLVSWYVSTQTLALQDTVQRATIFKDLLSAVSDDKTSGYAVLALWKLYPEDRKLVIISALQSDTPEAISALLMLGLEDELDDYETTILNVINNTDTSHRQRLLQLYARINPQGLLDLNAENVLAEKNDTFVATSSFNELAVLLNNNPELRQRLKEKINNDQRIQQNLVAQFTFALAMYVNGDTDNFDALLHEAEQDINIYGDLARLVQDGGAVGHYSVSDQEKILSLSIRSIIAQGLQEDLQNQFYNALETFEASYDASLISDTDKSNVLNLFEQQFRKFPGERLTREGMLRIAAKLDLDKATTWYFSAVACEGEKESKIFYFASEGPKILWGKDGLGDFATARAEGLTYLHNHNANCDGWKM